MIPGGQRILDLVAEERYLEALGFQSNPGWRAVQATHQRLSLEFRDYPEVINAINRAKAELRPAERPPMPWGHRLRLWAQGLVDLAAMVGSTWPVQMLAVAGTVRLLWQLRNVPLLVAVACAVFCFVGYVRQQGQRSSWYPLALFFLLVCGYGGAIYTALGWAPLAPAMRRVVGGVGGVVLTLYPGVPFLKAITGKLPSSGPWRRLGAFCVLFMFAFGLTYAFYTYEAVIRLGESAHTSVLSVWERIRDGIHKVMPKPVGKAPAGPALKPLAEPLPLLARILLAAVRVVLASCVWLLIGMARYGMNWPEETGDWNRIRFYRSVLWSVFLTQAVFEAVSYIPFVGPYIGGGSNVPRYVGEPVLWHAAGFLLYCVAWHVLALLLSIVLDVASRASHANRELLVSDRLLVFGLSFYAALVSANGVLSLLGFPPPTTAGFAGFLRAVLGRP